MPYPYGYAWDAVTDGAALTALAGIGVGVGIGLWMGARLANAIWRHVLGDASAFRTSIWDRRRNRDTPTPAPDSQDVGGVG